MRTHSHQKAIWMVYLLLLVSLPLLALYPSLNFALCPDDLISIQTWLDQRQHFTYVVGYDTSWFFMGPIYELVGLMPSYYFLTSILLRIIASASFFLPLRYATRDTGLSMMASLLFGVGNGGIDTTAAWPLNMHTYAGIALANLSIFLLMRYRDSSKLNHFLGWLGLAFFALVASPNRLPTFALIAGFYPFLIKWQKRHWHRLVAGFVVLGIAIMEVSQNLPRYVGYSVANLESQIGFGVNRLLEGDFDYFFTPFISFGYLILPFDIPFRLLVNTYNEHGGGVIVPAFIAVVLGLALGFGALIQRRKSTFAALGMMVWLVISTIVGTSHIRYHSHIDLFAGVLGGLVMIAGLRSFQFKLSQDKLLAGLIAFSLTWSIAAIWFSWFTTGVRLPRAVFTTEHRYLTVPFGAFVIFLTSCLTSTEGSRRRWVAYALMALLIALNLIGDMLFFDKVSPQRQRV